MTTAAQPQPMRPPVAPIAAPGWLGALPPELRRGTLTPFVQVADFVPLAASGSASANIGVAANAFFIITAQTRVVVLAADHLTDVAQPPITVSLVDSGGSRNFQSAAVAMRSFFGTAEQPYLYPWPVIINPASTVTVTVNNLVATAYDVRLAFHGFQVWGVR